MDARLERKMRSLAVIAVVGVVGAIAFSLARGFTTAIGIAISVSYGLLLSLAIGGVELFVLRGPMREWLAGRSLTGNVAVRSAVYAAIIVPTQFFQLGSIVVGQHLALSLRSFRIAIAIKRAIVFNGDVMNTAARLEELSREVDGGFLASQAAMARFGSPPPFAVRDIGRVPIRGRADGIDVVGLGAPAPS